MAARLGREVNYEEGDTEPADDGHENDKGPPGGRAGKMVRIVMPGNLAEERGIVDQADQGTKQGGANAGADSETQCDQRKRQKAKLGPRSVCCWGEIGIVRCG